jgi:hypothetical protein
LVGETLTNSDHHDFSPRILRHNAAGWKPI